MISSEKEIVEAAGLIVNATYLVAFTGAGGSVESGIPPFRGEGGLWSKYDPAALELDFFESHPDRSWQVIASIFYEHFVEARPNPSHRLLARLEKADMLQSLITQNIDNLHQEAGSSDVIEYHGNSRWLKCRTCGRRYDLMEVSLEPLPPRCAVDQTVLKPDFVFFGEEIPPDAASRSISEASRADAMLIIGTTGEIMPAAMIPSIAKSNGAKIVEINPEKSAFTDSLTDHFLQGSAGEVSNILESYLF